MSLEPWADPGLKPPLHENGKLCIYISVLRSWSSPRELQGWNHPSELPHLDQGSGPFCCPRPCSINQTLGMADPREENDLRPNIPQIPSLLLSFCAPEPVHPSPHPFPHVGPLSLASLFSALQPGETSDGKSDLIGPIRLLTALAHPTRLTSHCAWDKIQTP